MKSDPLVSVIIPTYNRADIVCKAIDSVLGQTYKNIEVIVVDDGSTDHTEAKLSHYGNGIRVITQENSGPSIARNRGVAASHGQIIAFLDSDDYWLPTKLSRQVELLEKAGPDIPCCLCNCTIVYNNGTKRSTFKIADIVPDCSAGIWLNPAEVLSTRFVIFNQAVVIRKEVLDRIGSFNENLPMFSEDFELALRLALEGPWAVIRDELVVCQDASPGSLGQQALREEIRLREGLVYMREHLVSLVENNPRHAGLRKLSHRELRRAKRELAMARLSRLQSPGAATLGRLLRLIDRVNSALFRRSPLYPQLIAKELR
jgi:glycosyltransferase involved in cell wall biosynthesis